LPKGGLIAKALQQRNGDIEQFRNSLANIRERIAEFEIELAVSRFIVAQAEAIVERNEHIARESVAESIPDDRLSGESGVGEEPDNSGSFKPNYGGAGSVN
jgi:hypothetical protein